MARTVIDPITRIEGHQRIELEVENGKVVDAWSSGTLFRGMEAVLQGRKPADAFYVSQRICGVCPVSHGHASSMGTEAALGIKIPNNARIIRNLIEAAQYLHSHILWFYHLTALDYVDVVSALSANVADTYALAQQAGTTTADFGAVQQKLKGFVENGQLSIFTNGYWGSPAYKLPAELNLIAVAHYIEAIELQAVSSEITALMGGKMPHFMTSIPGGTCWVPTEDKLAAIKYRFVRVNEFITNTLVPDLLAIAPFYLDAATYGKGTGNLLAWGVFEDASMDPNKRYLPRGAVFGADITQIVEPKAEQVIEYVDHSWYEAADGSLNPQQGKTDPSYTDLDVTKQYSWAKAPRLDGKSTEVGPLSRMVVAYASGVAPVKAIIDSTLEAIGAAGKPEVLFSLLGRVAARVLEGKVVADWALEWVDELVESLKGGDSTFFEATDADAGEGVGLWEAPRGALGHWIAVDGGKIAGYQVVSPSTWNNCPRDKDDIRGPLEEALIGCPVLEPDKPLEPLRIVHSFDP